MPPLASGYVSGVAIGDEEAYVLRRRGLTKYQGVMTPPTTMLLAPWVTRETENAVQRAMAGDAVPPSAPAPSSAMMRDASADSFLQDLSSRGATYRFLADGGVVIDDLQPDADGLVSIDAAALKMFPIVQIIALGPDNVVQRAVTRPAGNPRLIDLRLSKPLDPQKRWRRRLSVHTGPAPAAATESQSFDSVGSLWDFFATRPGVSDELQRFRPLLSWSELSVERKRETYAELACHETNLFLSQHDNVFFQTIVVPYLNSKKEKQLIDRWLLGENLDAYRSAAWQSRLTGPEIALLAISLADDGEAYRRRLSEPKPDAPGPAEIADLLRAALSAGSLSAAAEPTAELHMYSEMLRENEVQMSLPAMGGGMGGGGMGMGMEISMDAMSSAFAMPMEAAAEPQASRRSRRGMKAEADMLLKQKRGSFWGRLARTADNDSFGFFRPAETTKQLAESHFDRVRAVDQIDLLDELPDGAFWADLARQRVDPNQLVVWDRPSEHLLEAAHSYHEALIAMALGGLPLTAVDEAAAGLTVVGDETELAADANSDDSAVLFGQTLLAEIPDPDSDDPPPVVDASALRTGAAYHVQLVVSNATGVRRTVTVFWQIPAGAVPLQNGREVGSRVVTLPPYAVQPINYSFYFPGPGTFAQTAATVTADDRLLAASDPVTYTVTPDAPSPLTSWQQVAVSGTPRQIGEYLAGRPLRDLDLSPVLHRLDDPAMYRVVTDSLAAARRFDASVAKYALRHDDRGGIADWLSLSGFTESLDLPLVSPLLTIDPVVDLRSEHLEFVPLVPARTHQLGRYPEIFNDSVLRYYRELLENIAWTPAVDADQRLALVVGLLAQRRVGEAIDQFAKIDADAVTMRLGYDYAAAVLALHRGQSDVAAAIAGPHAEHPIARWRDRFAAVLRTTGDSAADDLQKLDRDAQMAAAAAGSPRLSLKIEGGNAVIGSRNCDAATLSVYPVDLEMLFSVTPFLSDQYASLAMVKPAATLRVALDRAETSIPLPPAGSGTVLVEVRCGEASQIVLHDGGDLKTFVSPAFGQLQATVGDRPAAGAYVKVFAKYGDGDTRFYKDGYTDPLGRFDYLTLTGPDAEGVAELSVLVVDESHGASVQTVRPPR